MTLGWTLAGTAAQLVLALLLFMMVVFSAGGIANGIVLGRVQMAIFNLCVYVLPATCVLSAGIVVYLHLRGGGVSSYGWYAMPFGAVALYLAYAVICAKTGVSTYSTAASAGDARSQAAATVDTDARPD